MSDRTLSDGGWSEPAPFAEPDDAVSEAIRLEGVHKSFGDLPVLQGIDLSVAPHEVICLIGSSGSGKSTLLRCVNLLEPVNRGRIVLWGQDVTSAGVDENAVRRHIGIVFQSFNLFPHMTVLRNITLGPTRVLGVRGPRQKTAPVPCSTVSASRRKRTTTPTGSRVVSSNESPSSGHWPCSRG